MGAITLTLDSKTGRIILITADFEPLPTTELAALTAGRTRRGPMVPDSFSLIAVGK